METRPGTELRVLPISYPTIIHPSAGIGETSLDKASRKGRA